MADTEFAPCPICSDDLVGTGRLPCGVVTVCCGRCGLSVPATDDESAEYRWALLARRSTSSVSEGEMTLPAPYAVELGPDGRVETFTADQVRAAIAADRQRMSEANGDEPEWWHRLHAAAESLEDSGATANAIDVRFIAGKLLAATKAAAPADAPKLDADELARLRRVVRALDMEKAVPQDDATLSGCLFSVLGMIAYELERRASSVPAIQGTKVVPITPTLEMVKAGDATLNGRGTCVLAWRAMVDAAPSHPLEAKAGGEA